MSYQKTRKRAFIDDNPIDITPGTTAGGMLKNQGYDTTNRSLVQISPSNKPRILKSNDRIDLAKGDQFQSQINAAGG